MTKPIGSSPFSLAVRDYQSGLNKLNQDIEQDADCSLSKYYPSLLNLNANAPPLYALQIEQTCIRLVAKSALCLSSRIDVFVKSTLQHTSVDLFCHIAKIQHMRIDYIKEIQHFSHMAYPETQKLLAEKREALCALRTSLDKRIEQFIASTKEPAVTLGSSSISITSQVKPISDTSKRILKDLDDLDGISTLLRYARIEEAFAQLHKLHGRAYFEVSQREMTICELVYFHYSKPDVVDPDPFTFALVRTYVELSCAGFRKALEESGPSKAEKMYKRVFKRYAFKKRYLSCKMEASTAISGAGAKSKIAQEALDKLICFFRMRWSKHLSQVKVIVKSY